MKYHHYVATSKRRIEALDQILELVVLLNDDMTRTLAEDGLTQSRARVLWELHRLGPVPQRTLAEAIEVSPRNITGLVDALVAGGFVTREPHPTDRRATLVSFTKRGADTAAALERDQRGLAEWLFADITDRRVDAFIGTMGDILDRLREALPPVSS